jgi:O-acetyl-ADP-ribose deacetylase (regulator of RNase III)
MEENMINSTVTGNLLDRFDEGNYHSIVHGCNCFHTMGAGIAYQIKKRYPKAYEADLKTPYGSRQKLGTYSLAKVNNSFIINGYTQFDFRNEKDINYNALYNVFKRINHNFKGQKIGIPQIGSGLAGGDWNKIIDIINDATPDIDIEVVVFS